MVSYLILVSRKTEAAALSLAAGKTGAEHEVQAVEAFGGQCSTNRALLGTYDLMLIADFPSEEACYAFKLAITATSHHVDVMAILNDHQRDTARELVSSALAEQSKADTQDA